jgi:hypothetical protein
VECVGVNRLGVLGTFGEQSRLTALRITRRYVLYLSTYSFVLHLGFPNRSNSFLELRLSGYTRNAELKSYRGYDIPRNPPLSTATYEFRGLSRRQLECRLELIYKFV